MHLLIEELKALDKVGTGLLEDLSVCIGNLEYSLTFLRVILYFISIYFISINRGLQGEAC